MAQLSLPWTEFTQRNNRIRFQASQECHRCLLASGLLPQRAGQPVKALAHIHFTELLALDKDSVLQDTSIAGYRARWAAHRAAASAGPADGGAWLTGDAARTVACDAMIVPVVTGDIDPEAVEDLIGLCVLYEHARRDTPPAGQPDAADAAGTAEVLGRLEQQILGRVIQIISGPGGLASFLRRNLLGKPLGGPSLPLDVGRNRPLPASRSASRRVPAAAGRSGGGVRGRALRR